MGELKREGHCMDGARARRFILRLLVIVGAAAIVGILSPKA